MDRLRFRDDRNNRGISMTRRAIALHRPPTGDPHPLATPPVWLGEVGKAVWLETIAVNPGLEKPDGDFLASYCEAWEEFHHAREELSKLTSHYCEGTNGSQYPHPAIGQKNKALERIRKFGRELGLAKSTRKAPKPKAAPQVTRTKPTA
jgi:P27 family predicted phage terminase small subunit